MARNLIRSLRVALVENLFQDIRYALRVLRRSPGFTAVAIGTLAVAIGATVTMFSVADAVLIRPVAYRDPGRLVQIWGQNLPRRIPFHSVGYPDVAAWRHEARSFESLVAVAGGMASLAGSGDPEMVRMTSANAELLPMLGASVAAGRTFLPDEDRPGGGRVAMISHALWQRRFGGKPAVLGERITLDGSSYVVVGVLAPDFMSPDAAQRSLSADVIVPLADDGARDRPARSVSVFARLRPEATLAQAQAELDRLSRSLDQRFPQGQQARSVRVWSLEGFRTREVRVSMLVLAGAVGMVLLIACVNVANLLLARARSRRSEVVLRLALGSSRRRLVAQLLAENAVLGLSAGAIGVALSYWGVKGLTFIGQARVPSLAQAGLDVRVLGFALLTSVLTVLLFGLGPALSLSRPSGLSSLQGSLKDAGRSHGGRVGRRLRAALVSIEVALSLVLLVGAVLLLESFARLQQVNPGFNPRGVLTANIALNADRYRQPAQSVAFFRRFLDDVNSRPGVVAVGITSSLPLSGHNQGTYMVGESGAITRTEDAPIVWFRLVSAGYFRAMEIPLRRGRFFDPAEERNAGTVIVNEEMASRFWPGEDPIGRRLRAPVRDPRTAAPWLTVVGVAGNIHHMGLDTREEPEMYMPFVNTPFRTAVVAVRTTLDPGALAPVLASAARAIDREQAVSEGRTLESAVYQATSSQRLSTTLLGLFAAIAVALAVVGLSGVTSYLVDQRTQEIGVRMALGAHRSDVLRLVFREGLVATAVGIVLGLGCAAAGTRVMQSMLFGVSAWNPLPFAAGPIVLVLGALAGIWLPARRATRIDPLTALREQ
jgi:putative ABC transport system permease protein